MIVWVAQVDNIENHNEDPFVSVYIAKSKLGLYTKMYDYVLQNILGSRGVGDIEDLDEGERNELFYVEGIGGRQIAKTKAKIVQEYFANSHSDQMRMWSETLD